MGGEQQKGWQPKGGGKVGCGKGVGGKDGGGGMSETKLFVGNLPCDITEDALQYVFGTYGKVTHVHIMTGKSRTGNACAFVEFGSAPDAETAILTLNDKYEIKPGAGAIM